MNFLENIGTNTFATIVLALAIIGYLIRLFIKRNLAKKDETASRKLTEFAEAKKEFLIIFNHTIYKLTATGDFADIVLFKEMPRHKIAYDKFRRVLVKTRSAKTVNRFDEIWNEYYCSNPTEKYDTSSMGKDVTRELVLKKIGAIKDFVNSI